MPRVDPQRHPELFQRAIGLIQVVVADAKIGADVSIFGIQLQRLVVPLAGLVVLLGIEVQIRELDSRVDVFGIALDHVLQGLHLRLIENGRAGGRRGLRRGRLCGGLRNGRRSARSGLLGAEHPAHDEAETGAGDGEDDGFRLHW